MKGQSGTVNAPKGKGKGNIWGYKGGYKGGKGKGPKGGKGKGQKGYRSPGKAIGKGLNYESNEEFLEAWGDEYDYGYSDYDHNHWDYNYVGNLTMMLEKCNSKHEGERAKKKTK